MNYWLFCQDCLKSPLCLGGIKLIVTDAPNENTLSTQDVKYRIELYRDICSDSDVGIVVCKDELLQAKGVYNPKHSAFVGNIYEKSVFAARCIAVYTKPGDLVLDPFCGYSSTGVAALNMNRRYVGIDISPEAIKESERTILEYCGRYSTRDFSTNFGASDSPVDSIQA